jgi:ABC-type lipoprotein release transport system permease subunit
MSLDVKMAWRNIWRHPRRTILTVSAIAFASGVLVFFLSWQFGSYEAMINSSVKIHAGHLQVQAKDYQEKRSMRLVVPNPVAVEGILEDTAGIDAYTFRAGTFSMVSSKDRTYGIMVVGIQPEREGDVSTLKQTIREGSYLSEDDTDSVLIGMLLAKNLRVGVGDELTVLGQGRDGSIAATLVTVKGIYRSGLDEFDRSSIQMPLEYFQEVYTMGDAVHEIVIVANSLKRVPQVKKAIETGLRTINRDHELVALDWTELVPGLLQSIQLDLYSGLIFYVILIIVVAFSILNTFLMAVIERTKEFGVMMAIGLTPGRLTRLLLIESIGMTMVGIASGIMLGAIFTLYFQAHGIDFTGASEMMSQFGISGRMYPKLSLLSATLGPAIVLSITFLAALYPALRVRRLKPVEAMLHV